MTIPPSGEQFEIRAGGQRADRARRGLAAEPMTCPPNGFATGEGLLRLEPGESVVNTWRVRLS
jgi:aldose 1-epimerase